MRTIAIGDIHGCSKALRTLLSEIAPQADDTFIFMGDYVDRGPDSRGVLDQMIELESQSSVVPLRGNHEIMLCGVLLRDLPPDLWLASGGKATVASYGGSVQKIPSRHVDFLRRLVPFHETDRDIFVHAGYRFDKAMDEQPDSALYWDHLPSVTLPPHYSGKRVFVGHTPQASGVIFDCGHLVCLDTYCFGGGWLTAFDIASGELWQTDFHGHLRRDRLAELGVGFRRLWQRLSHRNNRRRDST